MNELTVSYRDGASTVILNGMEISTRAARVQIELNPRSLPKVRVDYFQPWRVTLIDRLCAWRRKRRMQKRMNRAML